MLLLKHVQLIDGTTPANVEMVDIVTEVAGHDKGKNQMVDLEDDLLYDAIKGITKKKEIWRLGVILDDMWTIFKGDTEDHIELLVRDAKVMNAYPAFHPHFSFIVHICHESKCILTMTFIYRATLFKLQSCMKN
jgi:hypothetical protein